MAVIEGNTAPGAALIAHAAVDELLMANTTPWCGGRDAAAKAANKKQINKPFDAELGAVSP
jgi:hypothetical protein